MKNNDSKLRIEDNPFECSDCQGKRILVKNHSLPKELEKVIPVHQELIVLSCEKCKTYTYVIESFLVQS